MDKFLQAQLDQASEWLRLAKTELLVPYEPGNPESSDPYESLDEARKCIERAMQHYLHSI